VRFRALDYEVHLRAVPSDESDLVAVAEFAQAVKHGGTRLRIDMADYHG
jgi:hypothetical protein